MFTPANASFFLFQNIKKVLFSILHSLPPPCPTAFPYRQSTERKDQKHKQEYYPPPMKIRWRKYRFSFSHIVHQILFRNILRSCVSRSGLVITSENILISSNIFLPVPESDFSFLHRTIQAFYRIFFSYIYSFFKLLLFKQIILLATNGRVYSLITISRTPYYPFYFYNPEARQSLLAVISTADYFMISGTRTTTFATTRESDFLIIFISLTPISSEIFSPVHF